MSLSTIRIAPFFVKFNKYIAVPILSEWLNLRDAVLLCSSLGQCEREILTGWIKEFTNIFSNSLLTSEDQILTYGIYSWARKYNLHCSELLFIPSKIGPLFDALSQEEKTDYYKTVKKISGGKHINNLKLFPNVEELHLQHGFDDTFLTISSCKFLRVVSFENSLNSNEMHIITVCRRCVHLTSLTIISDYKLRKMIVCILVHARKLEHLQITTYLLSQLTLRQFAVLLLHCKAPIKSISLPDSFTILIAAYLRSSLQRLVIPYDEDLYRLQKTCRLCPPHLLSLESHSKFQVSDLLNSAKICSQTLQSLTIDNASALSNVVINIISKQFKNLQSITVNISSNYDVITLVEGCPNLTSIKFYGDASIDDVGFIRLAQCGQKLRKLEVYSCSMTDKSLYALAINCNRLDCIIFIKCNDYTMVGINELFRCLPIEEYCFQANWIDIYRFKHKREYEKSY